MTTTHQRRPNRPEEDMMRKRNPPADPDQVIATVVAEAARSTAPWTEGAHKVLISDVYDTIVAQGRDGGASLDEFKRVLLDLHRKGLVTLTRADLVSALPADKVRRSETDARGAVFHFVDTLRLNPPADPDQVVANVVAEAVRDTSPWAEGAGKVFISDVYETLVAQGRDGGASLEEFKDVLFGLYRKGLVELTRADLIAAMPYPKVAASEMPRSGATFHFIVDRSRRRNPAGRDKFERELEEWRSRRRRDQDAILSAFARSPAIRGKSSMGEPRMAIKSGEISDTEYGRWRVTFFGPDGPHGHMTRDTDEAIANDVLESMRGPFEAMTEDEVIAWQSTPEFEKGSRVTAFTQAENTLRWFAQKADRYDWALRVIERANDVGTRGGRVNNRGKPTDLDALDEGIEVLHAAIRELPRTNPRRSRGLVRNPPWVTAALASAFKVLENTVQAKWLPQLAGVQASGEKILGELVEFGCGSYGCVVATNDPTTVIKVTSDETEAEFASDLAPGLVAPICVDYRLVARVSAKRQGRAIHILWREAAEHVGALEATLGGDYGRHAIYLIHQQHRAGQEAYKAIVENKDPQRMRDLIAEWVRKVEALREIPELRDLAKGIVSVWEEQGIFLGDLHAGNLGLVRRADGEHWVITDPGHVAVIDVDLLPRAAGRPARTEHDFMEWLRDVIPLFVFFYLLENGTLNATSAVSHALARAASDDGFDAVVIERPRSFTMAAILDDGIIEVDLTYPGRELIRLASEIASDHPGEDDPERIALRRLRSKLRRDPGAAVEVRRLSSLPADADVLEPDRSDITLADLRRSVEASYDGDVPRVTLMIGARRT